MSFNPRWWRIGAVAVTVLGIASCAVQSPQPVPPPSHPLPPVVVPHPVPPPSPPPSAPKTYSGTYPERLEAAARDGLVGTPVRVQRNANTVRLTIPNSAAFAANSAQLQQRMSAVLDGVTRLAREYDKATISVKGYTDSTGSFEHNQQLSAQRAQSVGAYLSRGVAPARIRTAGYGPRNPIADNKTDAGRAQNRRLEIDMVVTP